MAARKKKHNLPADSTIISEEGDQVTNTLSSGTDSPRQTAKKSDVKKDVCFVIMPFGGWFDEYYEVVYKRAIEEAGLHPKRADDLYRPGTIVNDIWSITKASKIILADLTEKNANVFYELGIAHSLAKPAILITDSIENVPFDLRALRVLKYDKNSPHWGDDLRASVKRAIDEVLEAPLSAVLPTFLTIRKGAKPRKVTKQEKILLEMQNQLGLLQRRVDSSVNDRNPSATPTTASERVRAWAARGMPISIMQRNLVQGYGIKPSEAIKFIEDVLGRRKIPSQHSRKAPTKKSGNRKK